MNMMDSGGLFCDASIVFSYAYMYLTESSEKGTMELGGP